MAEWRNAATTATGRVQKSCHEVGPVTQVTRGEAQTPTPFHANVVAMVRGHLRIEEVALAAQKPSEVRRVTEEGSITTTSTRSRG